MSSILVQNGKTPIISNIYSSTKLSVASAKNVERLNDIQKMTDGHCLRPPVKLSEYSLTLGRRILVECSIKKLNERPIF